MNTSHQSIPEIINSFRNKNVLVIGDFILDVYLKGVSTRLSPEAPVPVVDVVERIQLPGGSGNTVCNLRTLGAQVRYCTVIGTDPESDQALTLLQDIEVPVDTILRCDNRTTLAKTRVVAGSQVVTRYDQGTEEAIDEVTTEALISNIERAYAWCDAVIISDYNKGIINDSIIDTLIFLQAMNPKFIAVDSKRLPFFSRLQPFMAKPNYYEAIKIVNESPQASERCEQVKALAENLAENINAQIIAVTVDIEGSVILEDNQPVHRCTAPAIATPHVSGAGDTYISAFVLSYLASYDTKLSAEIATAASTVAVKKETTSSCSVAELKAHFNVQSKYINSPEELAEICDSYRMQGKRIVFTNGCFDILHSGHVTYLHCAREFGDVLIVGVNTDESIRRIKGKTRPINSLRDRMQVLSGLSAIDHIIAFGSEEDDTPVPLIKIIRPHIFVKGGDYTKDKLPEAATIESYGGQILFVPHIPDHSTTEIIKRISTHPDTGTFAHTSY